MSWLNGLSLGVYAAGFWALSRSGFKLPAGHVNGARLLAFLAAGALFGWLSAEITSWAGERWLALDRKQARRWAALCDLPLLLLGPGLLLFPKLLHFGAGLQLSILGHVHLPWQQAFTALPPAGYLLLLWAGPWLTLPWFLKLTTGIKFYLNRIVRTEDTSAPARVRPAVLFVCALLFYAALGSWTTTVYPPTGDEVHYLLITHSLAHDRDLDLANNMKQKDFQRFYPAQELDFHGLQIPGKPWISKHFPLLSFLVLPGYMLLGRLGASLIIVLTAAAVSVLIYKLALDFCGNQSQALLAWFITVSCAPLATYFDLILTELPATVLLLFAVRQWLRGGPRGLLLTAVCAGVLTWLYPRYALFSLVLGLALPFAPGAKLRDLLWPALAALLLAAGFYWFYRRWYGFGLADNPYGTFHTLWSAHSLGNFLGLLVDRDYGILSTSPALILGCAGLALLARKALRAGALIFVLLALPLLFFTLFVDFTGNASVMSRYMLPGVLLLFPLVPLGWEKAAQAGLVLRKILPWLAAAGVMIAWLAAACPVLRFMFPKQVLWTKLGFEPFLFPSLEMHPGPVTYAWALGWLILIGFAIGTIIRNKPVTSRGYMRSAMAGFAHREE